MCHQQQNFFSCVTVLERVGHRLFVLAILLHEFQVKKTRWIAEFRLLECWKMIDDSKLPISYSPWWWFWLREIPKFQVEKEWGGWIVELRSLEWWWVHCKGFRVCGKMMTMMALPNSYTPWWFGLLRDSWVSGEKEWGGCIVTSQDLGRWWWCLCQILPLMMMMIQASQGFLQSGEATAELEQFFLRSWTLNSNPICGWQDFFNQVKLLLSLSNSSWDPEP